MAYVKKCATYEEQIVAQRRAVKKYASSSKGRATRQKYVVTGKMRDYRLGWHLKKSYNISLDEYRRMVEKQNGVCAVCQRPPIDGERLAVDHDHDSGVVRGLLCLNCNSALGQLGDSTEMVRRALAYLEK